MAARLKLVVAQASSASEATNKVDRLKLAEYIYKARQRRKIIFKSRLFGEPAWDILIDLYIAHERGRRISVQSAGIAAGLHPTTGLRYIQWLAAEGLIVRDADPSDRRRSFVRLSGRGLKAMECFLENEIDHAV